MKTNFAYALRNIRNNSTNSIITVVGLSVAIACCLIIYFYVSQEYSYNSFHSNVDKIYRINYNIKYINGDDKDVRVEPVIADRLKKEIPQIEHSTEYRFAFEQTLNFRNTYFDVQTGYAGEDFFSMFTFPFIAGSRDSIFTAPHEVVITRNLAEKLLGNNKDYSSLIGQSLEYPLAFRNSPFKIMGVIEDIPKNSSIKFDAVVSGKTEGYFGGCDNYLGYTSVFYQVKDNANAKDAERNVNQFLKTYYKERIEQMQNQNELKNTADAFDPFVLPLKDVYTHGEINNCFEQSVEEKKFCHFDNHRLTDFNHCL